MTTTQTTRTAHELLETVERHAAAGDRPSIAIARAYQDLGVRFTRLAKANRFDRGFTDRAEHCRSRFRRHLRAHLVETGKLAA